MFLMESTKELGNLNNNLMMCISFEMEMKEFSSKNSCGLDSCYFDQPIVKDGHSGENAFGAQGTTFKFGHNTDND